MRVIYSALLLSLTGQVVADEVRLEVQHGAINSVRITGGDHRLAVYGWPDHSEPFDHVLLTHGRRDVVCGATALIAAGAAAIAPTGERYSLEQPDAFWKKFPQNIFHDYAQQSTKLPASPVSVSRWVEDREVLNLGNLTVRVIATPGYTRGAATYVADINGRTVAFSGDLIYGDGRLPDLYSFQDAIPEGQIRGYHGYGARLADLVTSLDRLAAVKPDILVPARGPVINQPAQAIAKLKQRVRALYRNYLSTNALHWYFRKDRMRICGERVLGKGTDIELMPYSHHEQTPSWIFEHSTSRVLISDTGHAFLLDCGYQRVIDAVQQLQKQKIIKDMEGIFVTHYHDDHTDMVQAAAEAFQCPVYATAEYADVLRHPSAWHLPAMTANAIPDITVMADGQKLQWHEFELTFRFFPGQTFYHGALFARKGQERPVFFIGDAFAPSGLDDYCVQNRNLLHDDTGYLKCLAMLKSIEEPYWLVNEHIPFVFSFSDEELRYLEQRYRERIAILKDLFPWDDPNYGVDEQWAVMYPRTSSVRVNQQTTITLNVHNHSPEPRTFRLTPHAVRCGAGDHRDMSGIDGDVREITVPARQTGSVSVALQPAVAGTYLITADIASNGLEFQEWTDAVVVAEQL